MFFYRKETESKSLRLRLKVSGFNFSIRRDFFIEIQKQVNDIEDKMGEEIVDENYRLIVETAKDLGDGSDLNGLERQKFWKVLKNKFPKNSYAVPVGKKNRDGKIVTEHEELKHLYLKTYVQRLRKRPMKEKLADLKVMKEDIFENRLKMASERKTEAWTMDNGPTEFCTEIAQKE